MVFRQKAPSLFFDVAMSSVASLKVIQARKDGVKIPTTWIVDKDGQPTDDPSHYPEEGAMQPMAAHKATVWLSWWKS
jgi:LDH2 family malate/lactate/ureidoglycolate dehydrogenase